MHPDTAVLARMLCTTTLATTQGHTHSVQLPGRDSVGLPSTRMYRMWPRGAAYVSWGVGGSWAALRTVSRASALCIIAS
jgi:hypothetical protein